MAEVIPDRDMYPVDEFRALAGNISRTTFYELVKSGLIKTVKQGARTYVPHGERRRYLASLGVSEAA